ncbi:MAG TPA: type II toxin-antitoxin system VapC family toxin [Candidatus Limnocylindrales bacterium]|nr:type II toxin-antitoxin system VapC family toxin [Candidatus Limnocylindrales bacterium]
MTHYFLDSSALIKRYQDEIGSLWIRGLFNDPVGHTILIAQITPVEFYSGMMRLVREGTLDLLAASRLRRALAIQLRRQYRLVSLTPPVISQAQDLLEKHPLRAYDAVQLASANTANKRLLASGAAPLIFVSADKRLAQAAVAEGLLTEDPGAHG